MFAGLQETLYPLGLISTVAFTLRFLVQWLASEKAGASIVNRPFWWLSLLGNISLGVHSFIQAQFPIFAVQVVNTVISMRNLNLMEPNAFHYRRRTVLFTLAISLVAATTLFSWASFEDWMRVPTHAFQKKAIEVSFFTHAIGAAGVLLFASRFWVQWIQSELKDRSYLGPLFWWLSLIGALFSLFYFAEIRDYINLAGPLFGMIPYIRNLMLSRKSAES
jgi:lipid-A-disaccharide synthase-like uncharacterized protein